MYRYNIVAEHPGIFYIPYGCLSKPPEDEKGYGQKGKWGLCQTYSGKETSVFNTKFGVGSFLFRTRQSC
jgi:hypothetical protein